jgi:hypothetical protein
MAVSSWRALLLALCFIAAVTDAASLFTDSIEASSALGFTVSRASDDAVVRVDTVDAGGAAEASGVRAGDLIDVRDIARGERYRLLTGVYPHEKLEFVVSRHGKTVPIHYVAGGPPVWRWDTLLYSFASFWMLAFAALIAWRRAGAPEARLLCALLALYPLSSALSPGAWIGPSPGLDVATAILGFVLLSVQAAMLPAYASLVARPLSAARRVLTAVAYLSLAAMALFFVVRLVDVWTGSIPWVAQGVGPDWNMSYCAIPYALVILCGLSALSAATRAERTRIAYVLAPLLIFFASQAMLYLVSAFASSAQHSTALVLSYGFANFGVFLAPLGMTYALLNRRVLDIGFALNRVAIFSGVSIVVVGAFMLVEWALASWLERQSHTTSLAVGAALALLLGFSIRFVHDRVEHVLDRVFFRKRHEDELAIRRLAREAAFITDPAILADRTIDVLKRHADASFVSLALSDGNGKYGGLDENDPAIVSLRTWRRRLDLHGVDTQFEGEFAYPMISRGRLIGALLLGPKRSQESYAPDESDAIEDLADHVAGVLDFLGRSPSGDDAVLTELKALERVLADQLSSLRSELKGG